MIAMKTSEKFVLRSIADSYVVVPVGDNIVDFGAMITINETGAYIWNLLQTDTDMDGIVKAMCAEFDVDEATARADAEEFVGILRDNRVLEG